MIRNTSKSTAAPERERLVSPGSLIIFMALVGTGLAMLFPRATLQDDLLTEGRTADGITIAYLEAWTRIAPDDVDFLAILAEQYVYSGRAEKAELLLERIDSLTDRPNDDILTRRLLAIRIQITESQAYESDPESPERSQRLATLQTLLQQALAITPQWSLTELQNLATRAEQIGASDTAIDFYRELSRRDTARIDTYNEKLVQLSMAAGQYDTAAHILLEQLQQTNQVSQSQQEMFLQAVQTLQAGNLLDEALAAAAEYASLYRDNPEALRYLTRLALAADETDLAANYASALVGDDQQDSNTSSRNPIDPVDRELAYQVFVAASQLDRALQVARDAVSAYPDETVWLQRLAQTLEWNDQSLQSLPHWLHYAELTDDDYAWERVKNLAPALNDDRAYLTALRHNPHNDLATIDTIVAAYERLGEPETALDYLDELAQGPLARSVMERKAELAQRAGQDELAYQTYLQLQSRYDPEPRYAIKLANLLYVQGKIAQALDAMLQAQQAATPEDNLYWSNFTELATLLQRDDLLENAYRQVVIGRTQFRQDPCALLEGDALDICRDQAELVEDSEFARLIQFYDAFPIDAGRIAELEWRNTGNPLHLDLALYYYTRAQAYGRMGQLFASLSPEQLRQGENSAAFLLRRAEYYRLTGERQRGLTDLRRAVTLPDADSETRAAFLWAQVDQGSDAELRAALAETAAEAEAGAQMWGPHAAAAMRFNDGRTALHFLHKMQSRETADPLWLNLLADAYEIIGQTDRAWQFRRQAWVELHDQWSETKRLLEPTDADNGISRTDLRHETIALSRLFASGDVSRALVRDLLDGSAVGPASASLLGDIADLPALEQFSDDDRFGNPDITSASRDVVLAWALSAESNELARSWLARRYANGLERPAYAEMALALDNNDQEQVDRLLSRQARAIPVANQIEANLLLDRLAPAQTQAFDAQEIARSQNELQTVLEDSLLLDAQAIATGLAFSQQDPIESADYTLGVNLRLGKGYSISLHSLSSQQRTTDAAALINLPSTDTHTEMALSYRDSNQSWNLALGQRHALESFNTARFLGNWHQQERISYNAELGYNQRADESVQLSVGGMKHSIGLGAQWRLGQREFLSAQLQHNQFYGQDGARLGEGTVYEMEAGYRIRTQYPDYTLRLVGTHGRYKGNGKPLTPIMQKLVPPTQRPANSRFYLPKSFTQAGALFSFGTSLIDDYAHKWRPFLEFGLLHSTDQGQNFHGRIGAVGSVLGGDQLFFYLQRDSSSRASGGALTQGGMQYRWLF